MCCTRLAENTGFKKSPKIAIWAPSQTLSGYIFATKAYIDNRKTLIKQQYLLRMSSQYGKRRPLAAETPANFNGFRVLAALLHGTLVVGVSQTLRL